MNLRAALREPLLHFLLIGAGLFLLYDRVSTGDPDSRRIVIGQSRMDALVRQHQAAWNRPPTTAELQALIDTYVRDEILYREGLAMALDRDDAVIKRRVRQKYDLIAEESGRYAPTDGDLAAYLRANPEAFGRAAVVTFDQIYFDTALAAPEDVAAARNALQNGATPASFGQASLLPAQVVDGSIDLVARDFGGGFAAQVRNAPLDRWVGPVTSGYGVHLVRVTSRKAPGAPPLDQVRAEVAREWENDQRVRARDADYRKLRAEYDVRVETKMPAGTKP